MSDEPIPSDKSTRDKLEEAYEKALLKLMRRRNPSAAAIAVVRQYLKDNRPIRPTASEPKSSDEVMAQMDRDLALSKERRGKNGKA